MRTSASSSTHSMRAGSVTKYGERYPRSNCIPSTTSSSISIVFDSSTVMTPSLPTFSIALAINSPMVLSPFAEIVPTCAIASPLTGFDILLISSTTRSVTFWIPRCTAIGFAPATTILSPSRKIAWARTVAVVVPSPATSEVFEATSLTICAPTFSSLSSSSISFATVTPSLVIVGEPHFLSRTTFLPRGPSVTLTALARVCTPDSTAWRAFSSKMISFAAILNTPLSREAPLGLLGLADDGENFLFADDQVLVPLDLHLGARVLAQEDLVTLLHVEGDPLAFVRDFSRSHRHDLSLLGLLLGGIRNDDATALHFLLLEAANEDAIGQRLHVHGHNSSGFRVHPVFSVSGPVLGRRI